LKLGDGGAGGGGGVGVGDVLGGGWGSALGELSPQRAASRAQAMRASAMDVAGRRIAKM